MCIYVYVCMYVCIFRTDIYETDGADEEDELCQDGGELVAEQTTQAAVGGHVAHGEGEEGDGEEGPAGECDEGQEEERKEGEEQDEGEEEGGEDVEGGE
jgi:hypothetical protein